MHIHINTDSSGKYKIKKNIFPEKITLFRRKIFLYDSFDYYYVKTFSAMVYIYMYNNDVVFP
jgi:hypothetical protein